MENTMQVAKTNNDELVFFNDNGKPVTTSLKVAEQFGKQHYNVVRDIKTLDCSASFNALNFEAVKYKDKKGEIRTMYQITRDGFVFLAMGFRGKKAAEFKEKFINLFKKLEWAYMTEKQKPAPAPATGISTEALTKILISVNESTVEKMNAAVNSIMTGQSQIILSILERQDKATEKMNVMVEKLIQGKANTKVPEKHEDMPDIFDVIDNIPDTPGPSEIAEPLSVRQEYKPKFFTTRSQSKFIRKHFKPTACGKLPYPLVGKNLAKLSRKLHYPIDFIHDEKVEQIHLYHEDVIKIFRENVEAGCGDCLTNGLSAYLKSQKPFALRAV